MSLDNRMEFPAGDALRVFLMFSMLNAFSLELLMLILLKWSLLWSVTDYHPLLPLLESLQNGPTLMGIILSSLRVEKKGQEMPPLFEL